jgi:hypothetical protein
MGFRCCNSSSQQYYWREIVLVRLHRGENWVVFHIVVSSFTVVLCISVSCSGVVSPKQLISVT